MHDEGCTARYRSTVLITGLGRSLASGLWRVFQTAGESAQTNSRMPSKRSSAGDKLAEEREKKVVQDQIVLAAAEPPRMYSSRLQRSAFQGPNARRDAGSADQRITDANGTAFAGEAWRWRSVSARAERRRSGPEREWSADSSSGCLLTTGSRTQRSSPTSWSIFGCASASRQQEEL